MIFLVIVACEKRQCR